MSELFCVRIVGWGDLDMCWGGSRHFKRQLEEGKGEDKEATNGHLEGSKIWECRLWTHRSVRVGDCCDLLWRPFSELKEVCLKFRIASFIVICLSYIDFALLRRFIWWKILSFSASRKIWSSGCGWTKFDRKFISAVPRGSPPSF